MKTKFWPWCLKDKCEFHSNEAALKSLVQVSILWNSFSRSVSGLRLLLDLMIFTCKQPGVLRIDRAQIRTQNSFTYLVISPSFILWNVSLKLCVCIHKGEQMLWHAVGGQTHLWVLGSLLLHCVPSLCVFQALNSDLQVYLLRAFTCQAILTALIQYF